MEFHFNRNRYIQISSSNPKNFATAIPRRSSCFFSSLSDTGPSTLIPRKVVMKFLVHPVSETFLWVHIRAPSAGAGEEIPSSRSLAHGAFSYITKTRFFSWGKFNSGQHFHIESPHAPIINIIVGKIARSPTFSSGTNLGRLPPPGCCHYCHTTDYTIHQQTLCCSLCPTLKLSESASQLYL